MSLKYEPASEPPDLRLSRATNSSARVLNPKRLRNELEPFPSFLMFRLQFPIQRLETSNLGMGRSRTQRITTAGGSSRHRQRLSSTSLTCICTGSRCAPQPETHGGQDIGLCRAGECRATPVASFPNTLTSGGHTFTCDGHTLASGGHTCMCGRHTLTCGGHTLTSGGHTEG